MSNVSDGKESNFLQLSSYFFLSFERYNPAPTAIMRTMIMVTIVLRPVGAGAGVVAETAEVMVSA